MHSQAYGSERGVRHPCLAGVACVMGALAMLYTSCSNFGCSLPENPNPKIEERRERDDRDDRDDIRDTSGERVASIGVESIVY